MVVSRRLTPKRGADSQTVLVQLMEITHANVAGIVHGGEVEDVISRERKHTSSAYLVFVALDAFGKPRPVPPLIADGTEERRRQREAKMRRQTRLSHREAIERQRLGVPGGAEPASQGPTSGPTQGEGARAGDEASEPDDDTQRPHLRM